MAGMRKSNQSSIQSQRLLGFITCILSYCLVANGYRNLLHVFFADASWSMVIEVFYLYFISVLYSLSAVSCFLPTPVLLKLTIGYHIKIIKLPKIEMTFLRADMTPKERSALIRGFQTNENDVEIIILNFVINVSELNFQNLRRNVIFFDGAPNVQIEQQTIDRAQRLG